MRNRIISAPMERNYCNIDGSVTQQYIDNLTAKAKGGVGLIMVESTYVDPRGKGRLHQLGCYDDRLIPGLRRLAEAVHRHGAKISSNWKVPADRHRARLPVCSRWRLHRSLAG